MHTLAVTAFEETTPRRGNRIFQSLEAAQAHPAIDEIVVVDDCSEDYPSLQKLLAPLSKVKLYQNPENYGVFVNKIEAVARASNEWVITCDSDNFMGEEYLDLITSTSKHEDTWYCASFAKPRFDYRQLIGTYDLISLAGITSNPIFRCFFNTGNQTVHRSSFLRRFETRRGVRADLVMPNFLNLKIEERKTHYWRMVFDACDSFLLNWGWVTYRKKISVVKGLEYEHRYAVGDEGNYARSPVEKEQLALVLWDRLLRAIADTEALRSY